MNQHINELAPVLLDKINVAERILLHLHPSPDADSIGSTLAMKRVLEQIGKKPTLIAGDSPLPFYLRSLPGYDTIIEQSFPETDLDEFDLFISLDAASPEQITRTKNLTFPLSIPTIVIDHHVSNPEYGEVNLVVSDFPATAQILVSLFEQWGSEMDREIALNLFMGIYGDTGGFKYRNTTQETFRAAAALAEYAPDFPDILFKTENSNKREELELMGIAFSNITTCCDGRAAYVALSHEKLKNRGIDREHIGANYIAGALKSVVGWEVGFSAIEVEPGVIKFSFRTRDEKRYDVSTIASALGGGGHAAAAGASVQGELDEAVAQAIEAVEQIM